MVPMHIPRNFWLFFFQKSSAIQPWTQKERFANITGERKSLKPSLKTYLKQMSAKVYKCKSILNQLFISQTGVRFEGDIQLVAHRWNAKFRRKRVYACFYLCACVHVCQKCVEYGLLDGVFCVRSHRSPWSDSISATTTNNQVLFETQTSKLPWPLLRELRRGFVRLFFQQQCIFLGLVVFCHRPSRMLDGTSKKNLEVAFQANSWASLTIFLSISEGKYFFTNQKMAQVVFLPRMHRSLCFLFLFLCEKAVSPSRIIHNGK